MKLLQIWSAIANRFWPPGKSVKTICRGITGWLLSQHRTHEALFREGPEGADMSASHPIVDAPRMRKPARWQSALDPCVA